MSQTEKRQQVLTFPDIGCAGLIAGIFLRDLGVTYIPAPSNQGAEKSAAFRSAPEDMCLPFKLFAAQLEQAWHQGANTVVMPSSRGPCRLGELSVSCCAYFCGTGGATMNRSYWMCLPISG